MISPRRKRDKTALHAEPDDLEGQIEALSVALCCPQELAAHLFRQQMYVDNGMDRVRLFPVWRRYRWQAQKVARLQQLVPVLRRFPVKLSVMLSKLLFQ